MAEHQIIEHEQPQQKQVAITPDRMLQIAVEQGADLDKLEKLMDLQARWEADQARKAYVQAMSNFRGECPAIDRTREGHNNKYAGLAETVEQIKELLSKHGLSHSWKTQQDGPQITVTCCVTHSMGHSECTSLTAAPDTSGNKNSIQAIGSTTSYLQRYTLFAILGLASKDQDDDGRGAEPLNIGPELAKIEAAQSLKDLQKVFTAAWKAHTSKQARSELSVAKDAKKKELQEVDHGAA